MIAEEVAKMENEKLDDEGVYEVMQQSSYSQLCLSGMTQEEFVQYFTITLPKRMNGELPQPLSEMEDEVGSLDRVTNLTKVVQQELQDRLLSVYKLVFI